MTDRLHLLQALARTVATPSATPVAERLCRAAVELLGARGAALTCAPTQPTRYAACVTDDVAARLDEIEEMVGDGPAARAVRDGRSVGTVLGADPLAALAAHAAPPAAPDDRLPVFAVLAAEVVAEDGPVAVRSWPVRSRGAAVAALTVHGIPGSRGTEAVADGQVLADALAPALVNPGGDLGRRTRVQRAVGMVVAQTGLDPADAAAMLRARAWSEGVRVGDLAGAVLARGITFAGEEGPAGHPA